MSAERYEITDEGRTVRVSFANKSCTLFGKEPDGLHPLVIGAIRQQARDISELETDVSGLRSSEAAFKNDCDQLRADLAAAVAERDEARQLYAKIAYDRNVAESRLAAIDAAPTVAWQVDYIGEGEAVRHLITGDGPHAELYRDLPNSYAAVELIARQAKD